MGFLNDIASWFNNAYTYVTDPTKAVSDWFKSLAGQLAGALETGFLAIFKDLWNVMVGPLELLAGATIAIIAVGMLLRGDLLGFMGPQS